MSDSELDDQFALNRNTYRRDFLPIYEHVGSTPATIVQFPVILPFHLPFRSGSCVSFENDGSVQSLIFSTLTSRQQVHAGVVSDKAVTVPIHRSRVEMVCGLVDAAPEQFDEQSLSSVFDALLDRLNAVITAYLMQTKDYRAHRVSTVMFEFGSIFRVIPVDRWDEASSGLFLLHFKVPFQAPELPEERHAQILQFSHVISAGLNPFVLPEELVLSARRHFASGSYREAVITGQTAVETFLTLLLVKLLEEGEGLRISEAEQTVASMPFIRRVRKAFQSRIGGAWTTDDPTTPVGAWFASAYQLRNRIVHTGYSPTSSEAEEALGRTFELISTTVALVRSSAARYPSIQTFFKELPSDQGAV